MILSLIGYNLKTDIANFLMMPYDMQLKLVNDEVAIIVQEMQEDSAVNTSQMMRAAVVRDTPIEDDENDMIDG